MLPVIRLPDVVSGLALALLAVVYYVGSRGLPEGPAFFPRLLSGALLVLGATIALRALRKGTRPQRCETTPWPLALVGLTVAYALTFTQIGFLASTFAYTAGVSFLLGQRGVRLVVLAGVTTFSIYALLGLGLGALLP